jgi:hypothetical protein
VNSSISGRTITRVLIDTINAVSTDTWTRTAFIKLIFTVLSVVARSAAAFIALGEQFAVAVDAWIRVTEVNWFVAVDSSKAGVTAAFVAVLLVNAQTSQTRI